MLGASSAPTAIATTSYSMTALAGLTCHPEDEVRNYLERFNNWGRWALPSPPEDYHRASCSSSHPKSSRTSIGPPSSDLIEPE